MFKASIAFISGRDAFVYLFKKKTKQKQTKIKTKNENLYLGKSVHAEQPNYELIPV